MQIPEPIVRLKDYHATLETALGDPAIPVYIDTSVLLWLAKIGAEARAQFLTWCRLSLSGRVFIPIWAAHELYQHLRESELQDDFNQKAKHYQKTLSQLLQDISITADTAISTLTKHSSTDELIRYTRKNIMDINDVLEGIKRCKGRYAQAISEMIVFVNERLIASKLFDLLEPIGAMQSMRFKSRIPPGFHDAHKEENSAGDLVFWQEVIADLESRTPPPSHVIILTKDNKTDWYFKPLKIETYDGKETGQVPDAGLEVKLPHPLLEHELRKKTGTQGLLIINLRILSVLLDRMVPSTVPALIAATHPKTAQKDSIGINYKIMGYADPNAAATPHAGPPTGAPPQVDEVEQLNDFDFALLRTTPELLTEYTAQLDQLASSIPERNAAAAQLLSNQFLSELSVPELVQLGRRIFGHSSALSNGGFEVFDVFRREASLPDLTANSLAMGMLLDLYFDEGLTLRKTPRENGSFTGLFSIQTQDRLAPGIRRIDALLAPYKNLFLSLPERDPQKVELLMNFHIPVGSQDKVLTDILCNDKQLLCEVEPESPAALTKLLGKGSASVNELCALISRRFFVPIDQLNPNREADTLLTWESLSGLSHFRTDLGGVVDDFTVAFEKDK